MSYNLPEAFRNASAPVATVAAAIGFGATPGPFSLSVAGIAFLAAAYAMYRFAAGLEQPVPDNEQRDDTPAEPQSSSEQESAPEPKGP